MVHQYSTCFKNFLKIHWETQSYIPAWDVSWWELKITHYTKWWKVLKLKSPWFWSYNPTKQIFSCGLKRHQVSFLLDLYCINDDSGLKFKQTKSYSKTKQNKKLTFPLNIKFLAATRSVLQKRYSQKCYRTPVLELLLNKKRLQHKCFPVNSVKFLTFFYRQHPGDHIQFLAQKPSVFQMIKKKCFILLNSFRNISQFHVAGPPRDQWHEMG